MKKIRVLSMLVTLVFLVSATSVSSVFAVDSSDSSGDNTLKQGVSEELNYTFFNDNVRVYNNISTGTFDGGLLPSGEWAWVDSPTASAFSVESSTILTNTITAYNSCIWMYGFCYTYLP